MPDSTAWRSRGTSWWAVEPRPGVAAPLPWLLILVFLISLPAVTTRIYASDEIQYFAYLRSLWFDHDVSFENEYQHFHAAGIARSQNFHETFLERTTETGRRINFATVGCGLLWAPFYAAADAGVQVANMEGARIPRDGYSWPYVAAVAYASAFYGLLALLLSAQAVRLLADHWRTLGPRAMPAAVLVWIGTPLLFYMYIAPPMSHATSAFAVALFVVIWLRVRDDWSAGGLIALGVAAGLMAMVREQDAFFAIGPAVDFLHAQLTRRDGKSIRRAVNAVAGTIAAAAAFTPQALAYIALNGYIGPSRLVARKMTWTAPHAAEVVASPAHGFFLWTPLAVLAILGLFLLWRRLAAGHRQIAVCLILMTAVQVYVAGSVESWTVAGAFGQRRFVALTPILTVGLAALLTEVARRRVISFGTTVALVAACWWNIGLMAQFGAGLMNRQKLEPSRIAYNTFVVMPRALPGLAWRYVVDRASFFETARRLREK
jgi:hypothetical protein